MLDIEERLRADGRREAIGFVPSDHLPQRAAALAHRHRRQRLALAAAAAIVLAALAGGAAVRLADDARQDDVRITHDPVTTATTGPPAPTTTTSTPPATTTAPPGPPDAAAPPALTWTGFGGIRSGDTVREAEAATGYDITWNQRSFESFGRLCFPAQAAGFDVVVLVRAPGDEPLADPADGVIDVVGGIYARTEDGIGAGSTVADVRAAYGEPDRVETLAERPGQELWVFDGGGGSIGVMVDGQQVVEAWAGSVDRTDIEPCA
jgi:hypothetical protein